MNACPDRIEIAQPEVYLPHDLGIGGAEIVFDNSPIELIGPSLNA